MKILKIYFDHLTMFKDGIFELDLYASDKVPAADESVFELGRPIYTNNSIAFAGINASGKTTALNLLELACRIVNGYPVNGGSLPSSLASCFDAPSTFRCLVWHEGCMYLIESTLCDGAGESPEERGMGLVEETVSRIASGSIKKSDLGSWDDLVSKSTLLYRRTSAGEDWDDWTVLASPSISISAAVIKRHSGVRPKIILMRETGYRLQESFEGIDDVLRVFDSRIEHLEARDSGRAFLLQFTGGEPMLLSEEGLGEVLSSGTLRGLALVYRAMHVLDTGGYLLVDEIENHLNRQLVNVVLDLFAAADTNPHGATLVFTTHYPQLLDHIHRKDNVFFLARSVDDTAEVVKYSTRVKRIENKKSEVFVSNFIKGTAPRFVDVRALKSLIEKTVRHG